MRIISGRYARRGLVAPKGREVRPTSDRVREALFSALDSMGAVDGARVADLYAGSGALGLEALSRGARSVVFVDRAPSALAAVRANVAALGAAGETRVVRGDAVEWLRRAAAGALDLVLVDPPYDLPEMAGLPALIEPTVAEGGLWVIEHDTRIDFGEARGLLWSRRYGSTVLSAFRH